MPIEYREIAEEEYGKVVDFLQAVAPKYGFSEEWFQWKYVNNPAGPPHIYFAEDTETNVLAGIYCIIAWNLVYEGNVVLCAQSVDTMIHPEYRGHGIVEALFHFMVENLISTDIMTLFGFPNEKFFPITLKLGVKHLGNMRSYVKPLSAEMLTWKGKRVNPIFIAKSINMVFKCLDHILMLFYCRGYEMSEVSDFKGYDEADIHEKDTIRTNRTNRYLTWRFIEKPGADYRIHCLTRGQKKLCWIVSRDNENETTILDVIPVHDHEAIPALLLFGKFMLNEGNHGIRVSCYGPISKKLKKAGFIYREEGLPITYYDIQENFPIINYSSHWSLMLGDLDAV